MIKFGKARMEIENFELVTYIAGAATTDKDRPSGRLRRFNMRGDVDLPATGAVQCRGATGGIILEQKKN